MLRPLNKAGFPARLMMLARETFEASVAIHYHAPWAKPEQASRGADTTRTRQLPV